MTLTYTDAVTELMSYDIVPPNLRLPMFLLAAEMEYGSRPVARGRIRKLVERHLIAERSALEPTPDYNPVPMDIRTRFTRDVQEIVGRLDFDPQRGKFVFYWPATRQHYHSPKIIAHILQMEGKVWITERHVREAMRLHSD